MTALDIQKREVWVTSDGTRHDTEALAIAHANFLWLAAKMDKDMYLRGDVDSADVLKWIVDNKAAVLSFLIGLEGKK